MDAELSPTGNWIVARRHRGSVPGTQTWLTLYRSQLSDTERSDYPCFRVAPGSETCGYRSKTGRDQTPLFSHSPFFVQMVNPKNRIQENEKIDLAN